MQEASSPDEPSHLILGIKVVARRIGMAVGAASFPAWPRDVSRAELRALMRARRAATSAAERAAAGDAIVAQLGALPDVASARRIAGYGAVGGEMPLSPLAASCLARGQTWYLPTLVGDGGLMRFAPWHPASPMAPNRYAIPEPVVPASQLVDGPDLDMVLVPLVAFDRAGRRLGSGGGFYDRTFSFLMDSPRPGRPLLVGIGWSFQEAAIEPEPWDVAVDWVATETELIRCHA